MARRDVSEDEREEVETIIRGLQTVFDQEKIPINQIEDLLDDIESERVTRYIRSLCFNSKPEEALSDELIAGVNPFADYLFGEKISEPQQGSGFVDFRVSEETHPILVELKPAFDRRTDDEGSVTELYRNTLDWHDHTEQIEKYSTDNEYIILTDLRHWYLFSARSPDPTTPVNSEPISLDEFYYEFSQIESLTQYLDRQQNRELAGALDEKFFESLQEWVSLYEDVEFTEDKTKNKVDLIVNTINKFIFVQTLDSYAIVNYRWIEETWERKNERWIQLGKERVLKEFLNELTTWFEEYYDTELFQGTLLDHVKTDSENISRLYKATEQSLGVSGYQETIGVRGITNYNFREIDEDVFGKAYETYLVKIRKDRGVYYTPKYVTEHIVSKTVGTEFEERVSKFKKSVNNDEFSEAEKQLKEFVDIQVVDPSCGSGSFLIKALREIWDHYQEVINFLDDIQDDHIDWGTLGEDESSIEKIQAIQSLQSILDYQNNRDLVSKIILRHLHGVDLDARALEVAKLNLWLQAIKLARNDFRYENISSEDKYVLPDLELNLRHGDSLMALTEEEVIDSLNSSHLDELEECTSLRNEYLQEPTRDSPLKKVVEKQSKINEDLNDSFFENIKDEDVDTIRDDKPPLHWPLAFWYVFDGTNDSGFDIVIGNPPYYSEPRGYKEDFRLYRQSPSIREYYEDKMDIFCFFMDRAIDIAYPGSRIGYIVPDYWNTRSSVKKMNKKMAQESRLTHVVDFDEYPVFDDPDIHSAILILQVCEMNDDLYQNYTVNTVNVENSDLDLSKVISALNGESITGIDSSDRDVKFREGSNRLSLGEETTEDLIAHIEDQSQIDISEIPNSQGVVLPQDKLSLNKDENEDDLPQGIENGDGIFILDDSELNSLGLNSAERSLIKPFYRPRKVDPFYVDTREKENLIYTENNLIEYDGHNVYQRAREKVKDDGKQYSDLDDETKESYKQEASDELKAKIESKYPNITEHLNKFLEIDQITSDRIPYGIHRSRDQGYFEGGTRIVSVRKTPYPKFAPVDEPCYMDEGVVILNPDDNARAMSAVFNSKVLHFWYREGFGKTMGGLLQMDQEVITSAPIQLPDDDDALDELESKVENIRELREQVSQLTVGWKKEANELKSDTERLEDILSNDSALNVSVGC